VAIAAIPITALPSKLHPARHRATAWQLPVLADAAIIGMAALLLRPFVWISFSLTLVAVLGALGCYRPRFTGQLGANISRIVAAVAVAVVTTGAWCSPREALVLMRMAPFAAVGLVGARSLASIAVRTIRERTRGQPTLIVGAGAIGARMASNLIEHPEYGLQPIGVVDDVLDEDLPLPLLGGISELRSVVKNFDVRHVVVAFGRAGEERMIDVLRTCEALDADVWVVPRLFEAGLDQSVNDELWGIPVVQVGRRALRSSQWRIKRAFDIVVAAGLLLLTSPVLVAIALAVKLTSAGPILFRQRRVGQNGRVVDVLKFRSMTVNDDSDRAWNVTRDTRVTRVGRIIRPTSLDELPQLINVLRGDMSLVGPRPERPHFVELFSGTVSGYDHRHRVPVGLTGLSQVNGLRGDTSIEDRATFDNRYIDNWSLWSDIVILVRTIGAVVRPPTAIKIDAPDAPVIDLRRTADAAAGVPGDAS
jgi:exopolysaccharide biosynthesis polyprenyl glycosylphosphotransferase